jgi:hypothetical protein
MGENLMEEEIASFIHGGTGGSDVPTNHVAPQILIVLFLIYLFDNIIQLFSFKEFMVLWIVVIR